MKTIETQATATLLQEGIEVAIGGKIYLAPPPTLATLFRVSSLISQLPNKQPDPQHLATQTIALLPFIPTLSEIAATLILGFCEPQSPSLLARLTPWRISPTQQLALRIRQHLTPSQLHELIAQLVAQMQLTDFFALTTFLTEVNLLRPTKVENVPTVLGAS